VRETGQLTRGLRTVIALHVIFHWNRIGLPASAQATLAQAATEASFGEALDRPGWPQRSSEPAPQVMTRRSERDAGGVHEIVIPVAATTPAVPATATRSDAR
jgi:hypothetical protein